MGMIGKTRQPSTEFVEVYDAKAGRARGTLGPPPLAGKFRHSRRNPSPELASWIEHYWMVSWDLRGLPPYAAEKNDGKHNCGSLGEKREQEGDEGKRIPGVTRNA